MDECFVAPRRDRVILLGGPVSTLFGFSSSLFIHLLLIEYFTMKTFPIRSTTFLFVWPTNCTMPRIRREIRQVVDCFLSFPENLFFVLLICCFLLLYS